MSLQTALQTEQSQFVKASGIESVAALIDYVRKWLNESDMMPTKEDVLKYVDDAFDTYLGPMFKRKFVRAAANELLMIAVGELYDSLIG